MKKHSLYTYGTLQVGALIGQIVGRPLVGVAARLEGYVRYRVAGRVYPAIVEAAGAEVPGVVYAELGADDLERLDRYEGGLYARRELPVWVGEDAIVASTYVLRPEFEHRLSSEPWELEEFVREHLESYLQRG